MALRLASLVALFLAVACEHADSRVARGQDTTAAASDSIASVWLARARNEPQIASWLYLRAASATADSAARRELYARVTLPLARERIPWIEAAAREHYADTLGALRAYRALPAPITVLRIRASLSAAARDSVRPELLRIISSAGSGASVREGIGLFDKLFTDLTADEQLAIAHAAERIGWWSRARDGFDSIPVSTLTANDRFSFAMSLARTGADQRAVSIFDGVRAPVHLAWAARYRGALALLNSGDGAAARAARTALRKLGGAASDSSGAAALSLLADLQTDDGNDAASRATLLTLVRRFPSTRFAAPARFNAALVALILGRTSVAAREFGALARTSSAEALGAEYWLGRARAAAGDRSGAHKAWRAVLRRDSTSYYASLAAARLGVRSMHSSTTPHVYPHMATVDSAMLRVSLLRRLGMSPEMQLETGRLYQLAISDGARLLPTAAAFSGTDQSARAIVLGRKALARFGSQPYVWRLIYPIAALDTIVAESRRAGIDPALVAGLIRQESNFNPAARSPAGARGLMQVMPSVAGTIAAAAGITPWNAARLYDPGINIEIGVRHLAPLLRSQPNVARSLAAYNAGGSRVARWSGRKGAGDPEIFTERIPFSETRDYVKSVIRNREFYRVLYNW